jgi:hypothetical protein
MVKRPITNHLKASVETADASEEDEKELFRAMREKTRMDIPGVYIDRFWITYWKGHIRLMLGETANHGGDYWRFAAVLEESDVKVLIRRLRGILKDLEEYKKPEPEEPTDG